MAETITGYLLTVLLFYILAGMLFAFLFSFKWVNQLDEQAKGAPLMFRLMIILANTLLWIYLLIKIRRRKHRPSPFLTIPKFHT